jgi:hypothetical protein
MSPWGLLLVVDWLRHPWFVMPAALIASLVGLYLLARTWDDLREGRKKGRYDRLSEYRELYDQGLMSELEFARICDQLGTPPPKPKARARDEATEPGRPIPPAGEESDPDPGDQG